MKEDTQFNLTYSSTNLFIDIINQVIKIPDEFFFRNIIWGTMQDTLANHLTSRRMHIYLYQNELRVYMLERIFM